MTLRDPEPDRPVPRGPVVIWITAGLIAILILGILIWFW